MIIQSIEEIKDLEIEPVDIVIGVITKNEKDTIEKVIRVIDDGLSYFNEDSLILISDGYSSDGTIGVAKMIRTKHRKQIISNKSDRGKGDAIKIAFLVAKLAEAKAIVTIDGDLISIKPEWIYKLVEPILKGYDLVNAFYLRHKYDALITRHFIFPINFSSYSIPYWEPLAGERSYSFQIINRINIYEIEPTYGVDIYLLFKGLEYGKKFKEVDLGVRVHSSTKKYVDFGYRLNKMFFEVIETYSKLIRLYSSNFLRNKVFDVIKYDEIDFDKSLGEVNINWSYLQNELINSSAKYKELSNYLNGIDSKEWMFILKNFINLARSNKINIDLFRFLWYARLLGYKKETENMSLSEVYKHTLDFAEELKEILF